jgi:hypothetical protein
MGLFASIIGMVSIDGAVTAGVSGGAEAVSVRGSIGAGVGFEGVFLVACAELDVIGRGQ